MPPKRNTFISKTKRVQAKKRSQFTEHQQAKFRLMEISLKTDDHIYKNIHIPAQTAQKYIEEISVLIQYVGADVHCFQVAEKLTRVMTQIIAEERESAGDVISYNAALIIQPFLPTEHRQQTIHSPVRSNISSGIEQIQSANNNIITVDLCDDEESIAADVVKRQDNSETVQIVNLTKDINSLSMNDTEISFRSQDEAIQENSQSILTDYHTGPLDDGQGFEEYKRAWQSSTTNAPVAQNVTQSGGSFNAGLNTSKGQENVTKTLPVAKNYKVIAKPKRRSALKNSCCECDIKNTKQRRKPRSVNKEYFSKSDASPTTKSNSSKQKVSPNNEVKASNAANSENHVLKPKMPSKQPTDIIKTIDTTYNPPTHSNVVQPNVSSYSVSVPSYSTNANQMFQATPLSNPTTGPTTAKPVQIDLSWVENLKFIREVHREEYSPMDGLTEAFWNNCEFPPDWDDGLFYYHS